LLDLTGNSITQFKAFDTPYGAQVAMGDLDGDGFGEIIAAPGPGPKNEARLIASRWYASCFDGPWWLELWAQVAVGDGDGRAELDRHEHIDKDTGINTIVLYGMEDGRT
jgi:hypothetical protein